MRIKGIGITLGVVLASSLFFSNSVSAASDISVSNSGKVSFGKVSASSTGTLATGEDTLSIATDCEAGANVYTTSVNGSSTGTSLINLAAKEQNESSNGGTGVNPASYTITASSNTVNSPGSLENNTWGLNVINNNTYYGLPEYSASGLPIVIYSGTNTELPIYYGAKVTSSLAPGTYTGEVLYTVTVNNSCLDYTVKFDKNASSATGDMSDQAILPTGGTLSENSFTYSGYAFLGWSLDPAGKTGTATNGIGTAEDVDFADKASFPGSNEGILPGSETTLYAIWEKQTIYMQNWFGCAKMQQNEIVTLTDSRDNHEYKVKKLPDGKCWMINNLTLTATDLVTEGKALTNANTNIPESDTNSYYITPKNARYDSAGSLNNSAVASASEAVAFTDKYPNYAQIGYRNKDSTDNQTGKPILEDTAYYSFYTATLGYSYYSDGKTSGSSPRDICPKGWRIPKVSNSGGSSIIAESSEFANLARRYNSNAYWYGSETSAYYETQDSTILSNMTRNSATSLNPELSTNSAIGFSYSGNYTGTILAEVGENGFYWSSSINTTDGAYSLYFYNKNSNTIALQRGSSKYYGFAVRCVAQYSDASGYMQDFDTNDLAPGESTTLLDKRDDSSYTVKKFGSGDDTEVWMTSNLILGHDKSHTLTSELTNIDNSNTYYIPQSGYSGSINDPSTLSTSSVAFFNNTNDNLAKIRYATASNTGSVNPQNTGYYNFYTATLGFSYYNDNKSSGTSTRDICPSGWQLPKGSNTSTHSFYWLDIAMGGTGQNRNDTTARDKFINNALFGYSGSYSSNTQNSVDSSSAWWSSTIASSTSAYVLSLSSNGYIQPQNSLSKYYGYSIRCVAKESYIINYNANGGTGEMAPSKGYIGGSTLSRNTFAKDGYYFIGWSTDPSATTATYSDGAIISTDLAPAGGSATLYAVWIESNQILMQADNICSTVTAGDTNGKTLIDSRDGQSYSVYRFPTSGSYPTSMSGYCIMTKDLSLGYVTGGSITKGTNLTLTTDSSAAATTITARTSTSDWSTTDSDDNKQYINGAGGTYDNHPYYSYGAAQAVCPKGWTLPTQTQYNAIRDFMGGDNSTGSSAIRNTPHNFVCGGYFDSGGWGGVGSAGDYWSSTQNSSTSGYSLIFGSSTLRTGGNHKYAGFSVRCIAQAQ